MLRLRVRRSVCTIVVQTTVDSRKSSRLNCFHIYYFANYWKGEGDLIADSSRLNEPRLDFRHLINSTH
ncbi:hypothetical protein ACVIW0_002498 [Bradyrhizobium sp. USDA 4454]